MTRRPTAAPQSDLNPVATANAQINSAFDALANLLSGLPQGPVADLLGGALLLVRRSLFNQAPTANPVQYGQTETDIVGTLGAVDVEGNPITYIVSQAPQHGTVSIAADGFYTYIPDAFSVTDSTDTFTVSVADSATRLLGPISTNVVVPVSVNGTVGQSSPPPMFGTRGFTVYNYTQYDIQLLNVNGLWRELEGRPADGTVRSPGTSFHYELNTPVVGVNVVYPIYKIIGGAADGTIVETELTTNLNGGAIVYTSLQKPVRVIYRQNKRGDGTIEMFLLDPPNTKAVLTGDAKSQSDLVNRLCEGGGPATCSFDVKSDGVQRNVQDSPKMSIVAVNNGSANGTQTQTVSYSRAVTESSTKGYELNASLTLKLSEKAGLSLGGKWAQSWTTSSTDTWNFSQSLTTTALPWSYNVVVSTPNVDIVTGDAVVKLGNATWTYTDIKYTFPSNLDCSDPTCKRYNGGTVVYVQEPLAPGLMLQDVNNRFPNSPEYVLGGTNNYGLTLTAYNGSNKVLAVDYTTKKKQNGEPAIQWSTSDANVATVDATGKLTVKAPGSAEITATYVWKVVTVETVSVKLPITVTAPKPVSAA